ncbi:hypothetical protein HK096_008973 [Nowakowskiella sp. JEL0078]|nr:hypothetical protein HK096_008973 [Nowakowskiella sp. JEL0078]
MAPAFGSAMVNVLKSPTEIFANSGPDDVTAVVVVGYVEFGATPLLEQLTSTPIQVELDGFRKSALKQPARSCLKKEEPESNRSSGGLSEQA